MSILISKILVISLKWAWNLPWIQVSKCQKFFLIFSWVISLSLVSEVHNSNNYKFGVILFLSLYSSYLNSNKTLDRTAFVKLIFFVPETCIPYLSDSCTFLNCSVSMVVGGDCVTPSPFPCWLAMTAIWWKILEVGMWEVPTLRICMSKLYPPLVFFIHECHLKGSVQRKLRPRLLYIIWKLFQGDGQLKIKF